VGPYDWARVVQHEYTHTVTLSRTKNRLPHWFTEAGAVYLEDAPVDFNVVQILHRAFMTESFFDFDTINVMFARPRKPTDRTQAYMQGAWMYAYIIERSGMEAPLTLMDLYASGVREEAAFQQVMRVSREQFLSDFKGWFEGKLREWGMLPRDGQKTIDQLVEEASVDELTPELLERWRADQPDNPFVLERIVRAIGDRAGGATPSDIPVLEAYAAARPVDPLPHKLLAALYLKAQAGLSPSQAIPHLEYLDAREQNSPSFAAELAKQYAAAGDWTRALPKIRRATQISPYDATLRELAARLALQAGERDLAESHIWALTLIEPDRAIHKQRLEAVRKK
jgi:tetratricopeptide (TPR) repeat protein